RLREVLADGFDLAAEILGAQVRDRRHRGEVAGVGRDNTMRVVSPHDCETFADVGGLREVKKQLHETIGALLERPEEMARDRGDQPSADHREVVTQLMICLEEYRTTPGLVIVAGTNDLDRLDPALREGRFDAKVHVPLPSPDDRADVLEVHLRRRDDAVDWA